MKIEAFQYFLWKDTNNKGNRQMSCSPFVRCRGIIWIYRNKDLTKGGIFMLKRQSNNRYTLRFKITVIEPMKKS